MNIIMWILVGFLIGIILTSILWNYIVKIYQKQIDYFRQEWIKTHNESVEHFSNEMKLRELVTDAFNLIDTEYTFRRHSSEIWKRLKGVETHKKLKDFIEGNKPRQELKGFPVEIVTLQSVKDLSLALRMVENYPISWKGYELTLERLKINYLKSARIIAKNSINYLDIR